MDGKPRLLDQVREQIRLRHYSIRTETVYLEWVRRFIRFHQYRHPREIGVAEVEAFLSDPAVRRDVSASTQNQALAAILFLYRQVLQIELLWLDGVVRAKRSQRLPVVLTRDEVASVLAQLDGTLWLVARLWHATDGGTALAGQGCGVFSSGNPDSRRQGAEGQGHHAAAQAGGAIAVASGKGGALAQPGFAGRLWTSQSASCVGAQVSECDVGVGLAVRVSVDQSFRGSTLGRYLPPSFTREDHPAGGP
ncbi:integron integrase [Stutzerimonas stutzeri TS44]|nr:integron integrase [Stutzerimonas stutzeri TS44]